MSKGGGNQPAGNTTATTTNQPWSGAVPYITSGLSSAQNLYDAGGPQYFPGQTYVGPNATQTSALQSLGNAPQTYSPLFNAGTSAVGNAMQTGQNIGDQSNSIFNYAGNIGGNVQGLSRQALGVQRIGNNVANQGNSIFNYAGGIGNTANQIGSNAQQIGQNAQRLSNASSGVNDISHSIFGNAGDLTALSKNLGSSSYTDNPSSALFAGTAYGDSRLPGVGTLQNFANGDYLSADNPYFQQMADRIKAEVLPATQAGFIGNNRGVSGLASRAAGLGLGDAIGSLAYQNYQQGLGQQQTAANTLAGNTLQGASGLAGNFAQMMGDKFNAANLGLNAGNLGLGAGNLGLGAINSGIAAQNLGLGAGQLGLGAGNLGLGAGNLGLSAGQLGLGAGQLNLSAIGDAQNAQQLGLGAGNLGLSAGSQGLNAGTLGLNAAQLLPQLQAMGTNADATALGAGSQLQGYDQQAINDAIARWNYQQNLPYQNLNNYISQITAQTGGTGQSSTTQPYYQNQGANALGGALGGAALGSSIFGPAGLGLLGAGSSGGLGALAGLGLAFL